MAAAAMGTRFELVLDGACGPAARLRAAGESALSTIEECEARLSKFRRDSLLAHVNRLAAREPVPVDAELFALLERCGELHEASDGAFDPTATSAGARGWQHVLLDRAARTVFFARAGLSLDLGGIGKGYALDLAARALLDCGVERALLHGGTSSVLALDPPLGEEAWRIAIGADPDAPVVHLRRAALGVSAPLRETESGAEAHIIDLRSCTTDSRVRLGAVLANDAATADAWSTSLAIRGAELLDLAGATGAFQPLHPLHASWQLVGSRHASGSRFVFRRDSLRSLASP